MTHKSALQVLAVACLRFFILRRKRLLRQNYALCDNKMSTFNPDLARAILLELDSRPPSNIQRSVSIDGFDRATISYHIQLLSNDGLVVGRDLSQIGKIIWLASGLTSQGHKFLEEIRTSNQVANVNSAILSQGLQITWAVFREAVYQIMQDKTGFRPS